MGVKMLLKQSNPEHAHNSIMESPDLSPQDRTLPRADPLDDVFGSDDGADSPVFGEDRDDDFPSQIRTIRQDAVSQRHPSDMHRLQQEHTTAGYRDGVTEAKAASVQAGFDEGYGLGATVGLKVGQLLGLLEGLAGALAGDPASAPEAASAAALLAGARAELDVREVFGEAYWNADGTWKYDVAPASGRWREGEGQDDAILFSDVAEAHPLVKKWTAAVQEQTRRWGLEEHLPLLQRADDEGGPAPEHVVVAKAAAQPQTEAKAPGGALSW